MNILFLRKKEEKQRNSKIREKNVQDCFFSFNIGWNINGSTISTITTTEIICPPNSILVGYRGSYDCLDITGCGSGVWRFKRCTETIMRSIFACKSNGEMRF